jgi:hypothetical protein
MLLTFNVYYCTLHLLGIPPSDLGFRILQVIRANEREGIKV